MAFNPSVVVRLLRERLGESSSSAIREEQKLAGSIARLLIDAVAGSVGILEGYSEEEGANSSWSSEDDDDGSRDEDILPLGESVRFGDVQVTPDKVSCSSK